MFRRLSLLLVFCMLFSIIAGIGPVAKAADVGPVSLIPNPGFEDTTANAAWLNGNAPVNWGVWFATPGGVVSVDQAVYHSGQSAVKIDQTKQSRTNVSVNGGVPVEAGRNYKLGLWMKTENVSSNGVIFRSYYYNGLSKIGNGPSITLKGNNNWGLNELFVSIPENANVLRVEVMFETGTGVVWVDDASLVRYDGLTNIKLDESFLQLNKGQQHQLNAALSPSNAVDKSIVWTSSDSSVVEVVYGTLTAKEYGSAVVRVQTPDGKLYAECTVSVENPEDIIAMDVLRLKWFDRLTGNSLYNPNDPDMVSVVTDAVYRVTNSDGTGRWDTMNKAGDRAYLWQDNGSTTISAHMSNSYSFIKSMALVYSYKNSPLYKNEQLRLDIISALDWMYNKRYNENISKIYDNWYHWEIGIPKTLGDIMVLMYDDLTPVQIGNYINAIDWFVPDPVKRKSLRDDFRETGANLLDKAIAITVRGIVGKSPYKVIQGSTSIGPEYMYTTKGDGVYSDGSLVQHFNIAYTGGYGAVWLNNTADMMYLLKESKWAIADPNVNNVFQWVSNTFEPVIYKGIMMDLVNGREISRETGGRAKATILCIMRLAESAPSHMALAMKRMVKEWVSTDTTVTNYYSGMSLYDMVKLKSIMDDPSIKPRGELIKSQVFAGMDRVIHSRENFVFGISMFSDRISAFEFGNGENIKGWYTGMGMTSLYNNDLLQYKDDYWPTVNSYRLAGTTTDGSYKAPVAWASYLNPRKWVGGASLDNLFSTAGMDFSLTGSTGSPLQGRKSWFNFDDEIVALGSGISGGSGSRVETIVENRKINDEGDNVLTVNGQPKDSVPGWTETMDQVSWAHLSGNVSGTDVGYYFPENPVITGLRESRTGAWSEINTGQSQAPRTKNYVSLAFNHGANPEDASYSYVLLPGKSAEGMEEYSKNPDIQILSHTNEIHAARESKLGITAVNFWEPGAVDYITSRNAAAVMAKQEGDTLTVSISDPTMNQDNVVIELNKPGAEWISKDPGVEVIQLSPSIKLSVNVAGAIGRTFTAKLKLNTGDPAVTLNAPASVMPGEPFTVSLGMTGMPESEVTKVYAEDITIRYDPNVVSFVSAQGADSKTQVAGVNKDEPGLLRIITTNEGGVSGNAELLRLVFKANDLQASTSGSIAVTRAELGAVPDIGVIQAKPAQITIAIRVTPGDVNKDGKTDIRDLAMVTSYYLLEYGENGWNQVKGADLNVNGRIDMGDLTLIAKEIFNWQ
jgi:hyaluronate lyase